VKVYSVFDCKPVIVVDVPIISDLLFSFIDGEFQLTVNVAAPVTESQLRAIANAAFLVIVGAEGAFSVGTGKNMNSYQRI